MNPFQIYVLTTTAVSESGAGVRTFGFAHQSDAKWFGEQLVHDKPAEVTSITYTITPLEGTTP